MTSSESIEVSPAMIALVGREAELPEKLPADPLILWFDLGAQPALRCRTDLEGDAGDLGLIVSRAACAHLFGSGLADGAFHLSPGLRAIARAILDCGRDPAARSVYRGAKAIELLCETFTALGADMLVPMESTGVVSLADARRLMDARAMIDENWQQKLTIDGIARACGLNRVKLTRGFRSLFRVSVAEAIAERRLDSAKQLLCTTDKPVSLVGYDSGYLNNASFARAFARRFGVSPSEFRASSLAA